MKESKDVCRALLELKEVAGRKENMLPCLALMQTSSCAAPCLCLHRIPTTYYLVSNSDMEESSTTGAALSHELWGSTETLSSKVTKSHSQLSSPIACLLPPPCPFKPDWSSSTPTVSFRALPVISHSLCVNSSATACIPSPSGLSNLIARLPP